jgi:cell wall-associated NlpC family hydrolase
MSERIDTIQAMRCASVNALRGYVGTRFAHGGRNDGGLDCAGLLYLQRLVCGLRPIDVPLYARGISGHDMSTILSEYMDQIEPTEALIGDALWYRIKGKLEPSHLLVVSGLGSVIHAHWRRGVVEHVMPESWFDRVVCGWRFLEWAA